MKVQLLNFSGPYAVGKDTVINELLSRYGDRLHRVRTITTRAVDPVADPSYRSVSEDEFDSIVRSGNFLVNAQVGGSVRYGTSLEEIHRMACSGKLCIHSVFAGPLGAGALRGALGASLHSVALVPPGESIDVQLHVLHDRMNTRARDTVETIRARFAHQQDILQFITDNEVVDTPDGPWHVFDQRVVSGDLTQLVQRMSALTERLLDTDD